MLTCGGSRVERVIKHHSTFPHFYTLRDLIVIGGKIIGSRSLFEKCHTALFPRIVRSFFTFGHGGDNTVDATVGIVTAEDNGQLGVRILVVTKDGTFFFHVEALHFQNRNVRTGIVSGRTYGKTSVVVDRQVDIAPVISQTVQNGILTFPYIVKQRVAAGTVVVLRGGTFAFGRVCSQNNAIETGAVIGKLRILVNMDIAAEIIEIGRLGLTLATAAEESTVTARIEVERTGAADGLAGIGRKHRIARHVDIHRRTFGDYKVGGQFFIRLAVVRSQVDSTFTFDGHRRSKKSRPGRSIGITSHATTFYNGSAGEIVCHIGVHNTVIAFNDGCAFGTFKRNGFTSRYKMISNSAILYTETANSIDLVNGNRRRGCSQITEKRFVGKGRKYFVIEQSDIARQKCKLAVIQHITVLSAPRLQGRVPRENDLSFGDLIFKSHPFLNSLCRHTCRCKYSCY